MIEKNEKTQIICNIHNNEKDTNINKGQLENSLQGNNSMTNILQNFSAGISKEFPDNLRTVEYRKTDFPIKAEKSGILSSVNVYNNNINNKQAESIIQQDNINSNNNNFVENESKKRYCCGHCSKSACITSIVISAILLISTFINLINYLVNKK